jgi:hypothetical protein
MVWVRERTIPTERPLLVGEVIANFCGWRVPRGQRDGSLRPYSRFYRQQPLLFYQVASQLYSRGWVDPVPDPLLFSGSAGNRTRGLRICSQELWSLDHRGGRQFIITFKNVTLKFRRSFCISWLWCLQSQQNFNALTPFNFLPSRISVVYNISKIRMNNVKMRFALTDMNFTYCLSNALTYLCAYVSLHTHTHARAQEQTSVVGVAFCCASIQLVLYDAVNRNRVSIR